MLLEMMDEHIPTHNIDVDPTIEEIPTIAQQTGDLEGSTLDLYGYLVPSLHTPETLSLSPSIVQEQEEFHQLINEGSFLEEIDIALDAGNFQTGNIEETEAEK